MSPEITLAALSRRLDALGFDEVYVCGLGGRVNATVRRSTLTVRAEGATLADVLQRLLVEAEAARVREECERAELEATD